MKKAFRFSVGFIILIFVVVYIGGVYVFSQHFQPRTFVNDVDVSLTKISNLQETYDSSYKDFELKLIKRDGTEKVQASKFDYIDRLEEGQYVEQNPFYWFLTLVVSKNYNLEHNLSIDNDKFLNTVNDLELLKVEVVEPQDAKIVFKNNKFEIEKEILGNKVNKEKLTEKILEYIDDSNKKLDLEEEGIYYEPVIKSDDPNLLNRLEQMNKLNSFEITYDFEDRKEVLKNEELVNLYTANGNNEMVPDVDKAREYIKGLAKKYDTFKTNRNFYATGLGMVKIDGGIYGWSTDIENSTNELVKALENTQTVTLQPVYKLDAMSRSINDLGSSYVEIDLSRQHMWLYKEGSLIIDSPIVTGNPNRGNGTPTGVGKVWSRERDRFLTGEGYKSHVNYWLPFNWSGCGIHDSSWRSDYGKDLYLSRGSHGCVNTPPGLMPIFYENTFHGMPVVVYESSTQLLK